MQDEGHGSDGVFSAAGSRPTVPPTLPAQQWPVGEYPHLPKRVTVAAVWMIVQGFGLVLACIVGVLGGFGPAYVVYLIPLALSLAVLSVAVGRGLRQRRYWARHVGMAVQCVLVIGFVASFVAKAIHDVQYYRAWLATENTPLIAGFMRTELISDLFWNPLIVLVLFGPQFVLLCGRAAKNAFRP